MERNRLKKLMLALLLLITVSCIPEPEPVKELDREVVGIHKNCRQCNDPAADGAVCLDCHFDYQENHHPVDFIPPQSKLIAIPSRGLPLFEGRIQCLTCHRVPAATELPQGYKYLRGGPYQEIQQLCYRCHVQEEYVRVNVHRMKNESGGFREVAGKVICTFCHPKPPNTLFTADQVDFKADVPFLCWRCHTDAVMPGHFFKSHFLVVPGQAMKDRIRLAEAKYNVRLPLVPRGKISCATCHNPHEAGVLVYPEAAAGTASKSRLRLASYQLCFSCHR